MVKIEEVPGHLLSFLLERSSPSSIASQHLGSQLCIERGKRKLLLADPTPEL